MATKSAVKTDIMTVPSAVAAVAPAPALLPPKVEEAEPKRAAKRARKEPAVGEASSAAPKAKKNPVAEADGEATAVEGEKVAETANWLVVAKTVRGLLKASPTPMHCGSDALPALNAKVSELINEAVGRALANGRKTLKNCDF